MYDKVSANQNFVEREQKIEKFWADNMIFEKSIELRQHSPEFTFYDGPPTANGKQNTNKLYSLDDVYLKESSADEWWLRKDEFIDVVEPYIDSRIEEL